jgi:predicted Fe-Mo cluster-binding NifX family protein
MDGNPLNNRQSYIIIYGMSNAGLRIAEFLKETGVNVLVFLPRDSLFISRLNNQGIRIVTSDRGEKK